MSNYSSAMSQDGNQSPFSPRELRDCFGTFVTGVTVVTTVDTQGRWYGVTVNSFSSVSIDPPLILWSQQLSAPSHPVFRSAQRFAVNILAEDQMEVSSRFAGGRPDKFSDVEIIDGLGGVPLIAGCSAHLECSSEATYPGGDHTVFLGRVESIRRTHRPPLAFGGGKYMRVHPHG